MVFYKKRIEELERKLELLTRRLENNEAIGTVMSHSIGYTENNNRFLGEKIDRNHSMLGDLFDYLDVYYFHILEPEKTRLVKREEKQGT